MLEVDLVTPTRRLVDSAKVSEVKLPGADGQLTILPGHTELLTLLGTGPLSFVQDGVERTFAVSFGFAEVRKDKVLVLAETCEEATEINRDRAVTAQKQAEKALTATLSREEFRKHELKLQRAMVRQQVAQ